MKEKSGASTEGDVGGGGSGVAASYGTKKGEGRRRNATRKGNGYGGCDGGGCSECRVNNFHLRGCNHPLLPPPLSVSSPIGKGDEGERGVGRGLTCGIEGQRERERESG